MARPLPKMNAPVLAKRRNRATRVPPAADMWMTVAENGCEGSCADACVEVWTIVCQTMRQFA